MRFINKALKIDRIVLMILGLLMLAMLFSITSCFRSEPPSSSPPRPLSEISGRVTLPSHAVLKLDELNVETSFGARKVAKDGGFTATVTTELPQLVIVTSGDGAPILLGLVGVEGELVVDARTTAYTLLLLCPGFALADFAAAKQAIEMFSKLTHFQELVASISEHVKTGGTLNTPSHRMQSALQRCVDEAIVAFGTSLDGQAITPGDGRNLWETSLLEVEMLNDTSPDNLEIMIKNYGMRHVQLWGVALGPSGEALTLYSPVGIDQGLIDSAESLSFGSLLTNLIKLELFPSTTRVRIALPTDALAF